MRPSSAHFKIIPFTFFILMYSFNLVMEARLLLSRQLVFLFSFLVILTSQFDQSNSRPIGLSESVQLFTKLPSFNFENSSDYSYNETGNPCRLIGDNVEPSFLVTSNEKPLISISHKLFDVTDGIVPAITYQVSITIPEDHEFSLEYSVIGVKEDRSHGKKHRHQRERKHEELIELALGSVNSRDNGTGTTSLNNEIVVCSKNSIGGLISSFPSLNIYTFDWFLHNLAATSFSSARVTFRLRFTSAKDSNVLQQTHSIRIKPECNLRININERTKVNLSSLWNSHTDNAGLNCSIMLIPQQNLGLEITLSNLSVYGIREFCGDRYLTLSLFTDNYLESSFSQYKIEDEVLDEEGESEFSTARSSVKFCGKLEDYSSDERVLTFIPSIKRSLSENRDTSEGSFEEKERVTGSFEGESENSIIHATKMSVMLNVKLPGSLKSKEAFSFEIKSLAPCHKVFLTEPSGTLFYTRSEDENMIRNYQEECTIVIHVPYGNRILTELSLNTPLHSNTRDDILIDNFTSLKHPRLQLSPLNSINIENSILVDPTSEKEDNQLTNACFDSEQTDISHLLIIHSLDLVNDRNYSFCFDFLPSTLESDPKHPHELSQMWTSVGNQVKLTFRLRYFQQIVISYKALRISELNVDCDDDWIKVGNGCALLVEQPSTWMKAEEECQSQDGHLLTINNDLVSQEVAKLVATSRWFHPTRAYWIGANDRESEGNFQWTSGTPFTYSNWFPGWSINGKEIFAAQPNDDGLSQQDCVEFRETFATQIPAKSNKLFPLQNSIMSNRIGNSIDSSNLLPKEQKTKFHWNDRNCNVKNFYICEKETDKEDTILCNQTINLGQQPMSSVTITTPSYPNPYPDNIVCAIKVETLSTHRIILEFDEFVLENSTGCTYDSLEIVEKVESDAKGQKQMVEKKKRICGDWSTKLKLLRYISTSSILLLKFESDFSHHFMGFRAKVTTEKELKHQCSDQHMVSFGSHCYLFISYPTSNWKAAHQTCISVKGHLSSVLSFEEWKFLTQALISNPEFDKRSIYWLGGSIDQSNQLVWTDRMPFNFSAFHQSDLQSLADWKCLSLYWHRGTKEGFAWKLSDCNQMSGYICKKNKQAEGRPSLNRTFSGTGGSLTSVNFPSNYYDELDYTTHLIAPVGTRIIVRFTHLNIEPQPECLYDFIEFIDRKTQNRTRVCGTHGESALETFDFLSSSNVVDINFHSDFAENYAGFELNWRAVDVTSCLSEKQILTGVGSHVFPLQPSTFHTPNFPYFNLQGLNCVYTIVAPAGHRIFLSFEVFEIGNGKAESSSEDCTTTDDYVVIDLGRRESDSYSGVANNSLKSREPPTNEIILCGNLTSFPHATSFISFDEKLVIRVNAPKGRTGRGLLGNFKAIPMNFQESMSVHVEANSSLHLASLNYPLDPPGMGNLTISLASPPNYVLALHIRGSTLPSCHKAATSFLIIRDPYENPDKNSSIICQMEELDSELNRHTNDGETSTTGSAIYLKGNPNGEISRSLSVHDITIRTTFNRLELTQVHSSDNLGKKWTAKVVSTLDEQFHAKVLAGGDRLLLLSTCTPNTCANNGQCVTENNKHICRCQGPHTGPFCGLTLCDLNPCLFGECMLEGPSFRCICQLGYGGERCDRSSKPCDDKCSGHGECVEINNGTSYKCLCYAFWQGTHCEERMQHIHYKPLSERMLKEPFWLGIITVIVVLGIIGLVWCLKRHFPEKLEKLLNEDLDKTRGISWVSGRSPSSIRLGPCSGYAMRESIAGTSQQSTSPLAAKSFLGKFGIRKPSLLSLSSATSQMSATSPHKYETRTFSLDDLLKPSRSMMIRTPSPHRRRNFSIHGRRDPVEKQQILQQLISCSISNSLDGESKRPPRKPTIGEIIQMSEKRLRLASASSMQQVEAPSPSPTPSIRAEAETSFTTPLLSLAQQTKAEKKVTFARLLDKLTTTKDISSSSSCSDISCAEDKTMSIPMKAYGKKDRKGRFRRSRSYNRGRTSETESQDGVEMSSSDTTPDPIYTPRFPSRACVSPTGLSVSATNSPTPKQSRSLSKIPSADSLLTLFRRFSGSSSAPPSPQYSENEESSAGGTPLSTPGSPRSSALSLNIRPPAFHITTSEPTTVEVPVVDPFSQNNANWRSGQTATITLEVPLRDYCLSPIHEVPTPLPTPSHSPANSPMMQRQQQDPLPVIRIQASSEAEGDDNEDNEEGMDKSASTANSPSNSSPSSAPSSLPKQFSIPAISISGDDNSDGVKTEESSESKGNFFCFRRGKRGSESEVIPDVLIHVPPDFPSECAFDESLVHDKGQCKNPKNRPPPLVFANEILSYVKSDCDKSDNDSRKETALPVFNIETATPIFEKGLPFPCRIFSEKQEQLPDLMSNNSNGTQSSWEVHQMTPPVIMINQNSEAESDSDTTSTSRRLHFRPSLAFLNPFAGTSDRVPSESNLSTSGYSSMASPCPSRCPSVSPLCSLEADEAHANACPGCSKCMHHSHCRRLSLTPSCSRRSSLTTPRRSSLNGSSFLMHLPDMSLNESSENNLEDTNVDSAIETETDQEYGGMSHRASDALILNKMSPISEEMRSIYTSLQLPRKNFPKSQSLDMKSGNGKEKAHLKGESLDSKLNSIDPNNISIEIFQSTLDKNDDREPDKENLELMENMQGKRSSMSSRSDSPISDLGNTAFLQACGLSESDGVYDCHSSEVPGSSTAFSFQNLSPQQQLRRSGRRKNRRMSSGNQNRNLLYVNSSKNDNSPLIEPNDKERISLIPLELTSGLTIGKTRQMKKSSPKRRTRAQPSLDASSSSSAESLNSHSSCSNLSGIGSKPVLTQNLDNSSLKSADNDKPMRTRPKISRLKTISLQIRFLRRLEQNLIRKREALAFFSGQSEKSESPLSRTESKRDADDSSSCSSTSSSTSTCSTCSSCSSCNEEEGDNRSDYEDHANETDKPLLRRPSNLPKKKGRKVFSQSLPKGKSRRFQ